MKIFIIISFMLVIFNSKSQDIVIQPTSNHDGGTYSIYRGIEQNNLTIGNLNRAIIWVEGFEVNNEVSIEANYLMLGIDLRNQLHAAGYDIVILNFNNPNDYIQRNAKVLQELIQTINSDKPNDLIKNSDFK